MRLAYDRGIRAMMLSSHPRAEALCDAIRKDPKAWEGFTLYPGIPYAFKYVMALNEKGFYKMIVDQVKTAGIKASLSMLLTSGAGLAKKDYMKLIRVLIDLEMQFFRDIPVGAVFLHNVVTDLVLSLKIEGVLEYYADHIREKHGLRPAFGTLNLPLLLERLDAENIDDAIVMTSVNKAGFFMNPSQQACEDALKDERWDVMAMSILASGAIPPDEAFAYAVQYPSVKSLLFGASRASTLDKSIAIINKLDSR